MAKNELLVIDRTYELVKWYLGRLEKFPRSHRYGLGQRIETRLYAIFEGLIRAKEPRKGFNKVARGKAAAAGRHLGHASLRARLGSEQNSQLPAHSNAICAPDLVARISPD